MKKWFLCIGLVLFIGAMILSTEALSNVEKPLWSVELELHASCLKPQVVEVAVFRSAPFPGYVERLKKLHKRHSSVKAKTPEEKRRIQNLIIKIAWNTEFEKIRGNEVSLLEGFKLETLDCDTVIGEKGKRIVTHVKGKVHVICDDDSGKKWILTKARPDTLGILRCWCIPIECKLGESVRQKLSLENAFDLYEKYREVIREK